MMAWEPRNVAWAIWMEKKKPEMLNIPSRRDEDERD